MRVLLTLDTNVLRDCDDSNRPGHMVAMELLGLHHLGECEIRTTTRLDVDVPREPLRSRLSALNPLPQMGTAFRIGASNLGSGDVLVDDQWVADEERLLTLIFPMSSPCSPKHKNRLADVDHLLGHRHNGRDIFVTGEVAILSRASDLEKDFGIKVVSPADAVHYIKGNSEQI